MRALGQALAAATGAALLVAMSFPRVAYHAHILASGALEDQMRTETRDCAQRSDRGSERPQGCGGTRDMRLVGRGGASPPGRS